MVKFGNMTCRITLKSTLNIHHYFYFFVLDFCAQSSLQQKKYLTSHDVSMFAPKKVLNSVNQHKNMALECEQSGITLQQLSENNDYRKYIF